MKKTIATEIKITFYIVLISVLITGIGYLTISQVSKPTYISDDDIHQMDSLKIILEKRASLECEECRNKRVRFEKSALEFRYFSKLLEDDTLAAYYMHEYDNCKKKEGLIGIDYTNVYKDNGWQGESFVIGWAYYEPFHFKTFNNSLKYYFEDRLKDKTLFLFIISLVGIIISRYLCLGVLWVIKHSK